MSHVDHLTLENRRLRDEIDRLQVSGLASHTAGHRPVESRSLESEKPHLERLSLAIQGCAGPCQLCGELRQQLAEQGSGLHAPA